MADLAESTSTVGITTMNNPSWKILFYILGGVTMLWSVVLGFILPDNPANAWFLKKNERVLGVKRVAQNDVGIKSKVRASASLPPSPPVHTLHV